MNGGSAKGKCPFHGLWSSSDSERPATPGPKEAAKPVGQLRLSFLLSDLNGLMGRLSALFAQHDVVQVKAEIPLKLFCFWRPQHILQLYTQKSTALAKPPHNMMEREEWLMGKNVVTDTGGDWRRRRDVHAPAFRPSNLDQLLRPVPEATDRMFAGLDSIAGKEPVDIFQEMRRLTLDFAYSLVFSEVLGERLERVSQAVEFAEEMFPVQVPPFFLPTPRNLRFRREARFLKDLTRELLDKRRADPAPKADLLSFLQQAEDAALGRRWTEDELVDELFGIILGTSAVATALGWTFYLLAKQPPVARRLERELEGAFEGGTPSTQALAELPYLDWVLKESMRLYPPFWGSVRYSPEAIEMDGYRFPAKSTFLSVRFFSQRHPQYWDNPLAFDPERFGSPLEATNRLQKNNPANLLPFGSGPRTCLGVHLAPLVCKRVIAEVVRRYALELEGRSLNPEARVRFAYGLYPEEKISLSLRSKIGLRGTAYDPGLGHRLAHPETKP